MVPISPVTHAASPETASSMVRLSPREKACLQLAADGNTSAQIAFLLGISEPCVNLYFKTAKRKLGGRTRVGLVAKAIRLGLIR